MVSSITLNASRKKQEKREGEVRYMEDKLGKSEDHPEDTTYTHARSAWFKYGLPLADQVQSRRDRGQLEESQGRMGPCNAS